MRVIMSALIIVVFLGLIIVGSACLRSKIARASETEWSSSRPTVLSLHLTMSDDALGESSNTDDTHKKHVIPPDFVGLSLEWSEQLERWATSPTVHSLLSYLSNPQQTLFSNLTDKRGRTLHENNHKLAATVASLNIRVGGNSADRSWWWTPNKTQSDSCHAYYNHSLCVQHELLEAVKPLRMLT